MSGLSVALQIVGSVAGAYIPGAGALGAYFGGLAGGLIGSAIDPNRTEGPHLGDLNVRASTYGKTIPLVYGRQNRIGGNVIWSSNLVEHEQKEGDWFSGYQVSYNYTASFAIALGAGPMRNIEAIYANGKLIWTRQGTLDNLAKLDIRDGKQAAFCNPIRSGFAFCMQRRNNAPFLSSYVEAALMPDFTPWMLARQVGAATSGGGGIAHGGRNAVLFSGGDFSEMEWFPGTVDQPTSIFMGADRPAYRGTAYLVFRDMQLGRFGNQIPTIEVVCSGLRGDTVDQVLADICDRAGATVDEVVPRGALSEFPLRGYSVGSARNAFSAIVPLMKVYPFDACDQDGQVRFTPRQTSPVCTIPLEDMGARRPDENRLAVFPIERLPNHELPSEASLTYTDPDNGYQQGTQTARRAGGDSASVLNEQVAITLTGDEASAVAERMLWEGWLTREQVRPMRTSPKYGHLQPGNLFAAQVPGGYTVFRALDVQRGDDGIIEIAAAREDAVAYEGNMPGGAVYVFEQNPTIYEDIEARLINAPMLTTDDDDSGFHCAFDTAGASWSQATLERSVDQGATWQTAAYSQRRNTVGIALALLPSGPTDIWDRLNTISVDLLNVDAELETLTEDQVLGNAMLNLLWVGSASGRNGELIQFTTAQRRSGTTWDLSGLLRGRRGTEHYVGSHAVGDAVVLIPTDGLGTVDYGQSEWGLERFYTALALGQDEEDSVPFVFTATGERLKPRSGVHGAGARDGANNLTLTWARRNRQFPPTLGGGEVPVGEALEAYEVDVVVGGSPDIARTLTTNTPSVEYTAAEQTADGLAPGSPVTFRVYQISATIGRGYPAEFTV
jgi:hypothetical protein